MHSFAVAAFLALCATQCLAAPRFELGVFPGGEKGHDFLGQPQIIGKRSPVVVETESTGDAATDAKVADELKKVGPALQAEGNQLAPMVKAEEEALPKLMDDLEAAMLPLLEMANMMQVEADTVANAEATAEKATTADTTATDATTDASTDASKDASTDASTDAATTPKTTRRQARALQLAARNADAEPFWGAVIPIASAVAGAIGDAINKREAEADPFVGALAPAIKGVAKGVTEIIGMFDKREAELQAGFEKRKLPSAKTIKNIDGAGEIIVDWIDDKMHGH